MTNKATNALAEALRERMEALNAEGDRVANELSELSAAGVKKHNQLELLRAEWRELQTLHARYSAGKTADLPAMPGESAPPQPQTEKARPTDVVIEFVKSANGRHRTRAEVVAALRERIEKGEVATGTSDPAKLASSLVGNMIRNFRLLEDADGNVSLPTPTVR